MPREFDFDDLMNQSFPKILEELKKLSDHPFKQNLAFLAMFLNFFHRLIDSLVGAGESDKAKAVLLATVEVFMKGVAQTVQSNKKGLDGVKMTTSDVNAKSKIEDSLLSMISLGDKLPKEVLESLSNDPEVQNFKTFVESFDFSADSYMKDLKANNNELVKPLIKGEKNMHMKLVKDWNMRFPILAQVRGRNVEMKLSGNKDMHRDSVPDDVKKTGGQLQLIDQEGREYWGYFYREGSEYPLYLEEVK